MSFDWQTEDRDWNAWTPPPEVGQREDGDPVPDGGIYSDRTPAIGQHVDSPRRRLPRRLTVPVAVVLLFFALAAVIYWQVDRRARAGQERVTAEVIASHGTILEAVRGEDAELFVGFLSGRDPAWAEAQERLVREGAFLDRSIFNLSVNSTTPVTPTVVLSPDLRLAELTAPVAYSLEIGNGLTETVTLSQTAIFRLGPDRWLYAPPEAEFWGPTLTGNGRYARVTYPQRDEETAGRLARDLDNALAELCRLAGDDCAAMRPLEVTMSTDPAALAAYTRPEVAWSGGSTVVLPTPTLFGLPGDEAGYRAIYRAYAARVIASAAANLVGWQCCDDRLFYGVLLDALLYRAGLRVWPVTAEDYEQLANHPEALSQVGRLWRATDATAEERRTVYLLVDFLIARQGEASIIDMQRLLLDAVEEPYWGWISQVTGGAYGSQADFERDWLRHTAERRANATPPLPLPDQTLRLVCRQPGELRPALYYFDPRQGELRTDHGLDIFTEPMIVGLPGRDGIVMFGRDTIRETTAPVIWKDGIATDIFFSGVEGGPSLVALPPEQPDSSLFLVQDSPSATPLYAFLSPADCEGKTGCVANPILGTITLSPNRSTGLLAVGEPPPFLSARRQAMLYVGEPPGEPETLIELGTSPFWVDDQSFGYIGLSADLGEQQVFVRDLTGSDTERGNPAITSPTLLFTSSDLNRLPLGDPDTRLIIDRVLPNPGRSELLVFTASPFRAGQSSLALAYNSDTRRFRPRFRVENEPFDYRRAYRFSPDGRWLAVGALMQSVEPESATTWGIYLHAIDDSMTHEYLLQTSGSWPADWLMDWSADGRWLALATAGYVRLIAPDEDYSIPMILPDLSCSAAVWVNRDRRG